MKITTLTSEILLIGHICGDSCMGEEGTCYCGLHEEFRPHDGYYCCTPPNTTCYDSYPNVLCDKGRKLRVHEFCSEQDMCPRLTTEYDTAIITDCGKYSIQFCPQSDAGQKFCSNVEDIGERFCPNHLMCAKPIGGLAYSQCYVEE